MTPDIQTVKQRFAIIGNHFRLNEAIRVAIQVAPTDLSVLIMGESGVGKEFFPRIIQAYSARKNKKYIAVNCGAIPEGTIDSELFGHRKGSFTGAISDRKGYFEEADGGTIFLDEIGELPLATQARLLRVLEGGDFIPVGASIPQKTDVRIVAATNVNLRKAIAEGKFREDLYYRLSSVPIEIPPLRERTEDIPLLFQKFSIDIAAKYNIPTIELTDDARNLLVAYRWPGNIRELKNVAERVTLLEPDRILQSTLLQAYLREDGLTDIHPAIIPERQINGEGSSFNNEREILYKVLFDLNRSVQDLKAQVDELKGEKKIREENSPIKPSAYPSIPTISPPQSKERNKQTPHIDDILHPIYSEEINDNMPLEQALDALRGLTLKEIEEKLIAHTLNRNNGSRSETAKELGIADRTLYRRLKEFDLL